MSDFEIPFAGSLGIEIVSSSKDEVRARMSWRADLCTTLNIMHGGAIMAIADTLGGSATSLNLPPGAGTTTIESKTNFFAPARTGETVRAECTALHRGKRTMVWQTRVTGPDGRLIALVTQTQIVLDPQRTPQEQIVALFEDKSLVERKALLAQLERGGAALYRSFAADEPDTAAREELLQAAAREEENAVVLETSISDEDTAAS
jgi:uncharacterized protein (TIGR00369 family)